MVTVAPGAAPGSSDFDVKAGAGPRFGGYIMGDNQGSKYTGRNRVYSGINVNSPFGIADKLSVSGMTTDRKKGILSGRVSYGFPLTCSGLRAEVVASRTTNRLGDDFSDLDATGSVDILEGGLSYPVVRNRDNKLDLSLKGVYRHMKEEIGAVDFQGRDDVSKVALGMEGTHWGSLFGRPFAATVSFSVTLGKVTTLNREQRALNEAGANTEGAFSKGNLALSGELGLTGKLSLRTAIRLQKAFDRNLDPTEWLYVSGITGVKAYTEPISFDNGYVANAELRYSLPAILGITHSLGLFAENAHVYAQHGDYLTEDKTNLSDAGLGYYLSFKQYFGAVQVAQPIGRSSFLGAAQDPGTRLLAQVGLNF